MGDNSAANPNVGTDYYGPILHSEALTIGSSPALASTYVPASTGSCLCALMAVWMGTDNRLWSEYWYNNGSGNSSYSVQVDASALDIGSAPSIAGSPAGNAFDIAWQGTDGRLWLAAFDPSTKHFSSPEVVSIAGQLGSAPSIAEGIGSPNTWIFWKGRNDSHLWEAFWNASTSTWSLIDRGMGPLGPTG